MRTVTAVELAGPAGRLSGLLHRPAGEPRLVGVVSHPHPLFGGTMDNKVAYRTARGLEACGGIVLRYDFRGVRRSEGAHDEGVGEQDDCRAALQFTRSQPGAAGLPAVLAGFSFGSIVSSHVASAGRDDVAALVLVGAPVLRHRFAELADRPAGMPVACVQGGRDEHGPLDVLHAAWSEVPEPKRLTVLETAGHFFDDEQDELFEAVRAATEWALGGEKGA